MLTTPTESCNTPELPVCGSLSTPHYSLPFSANSATVTRKIIGSLMTITLFSKDGLKSVLAGVCLCSFLFVFETQAQQILYWDPFGTNSANSSNSYAWDGSAQWSTSLNLTTNLVPWSNGAAAFFSAGNAAISTGLNVTGIQNISGIYNGTSNSLGQFLVFGGTGSLYLVPGQVLISTCPASAFTGFSLTLSGPGQLALQGPGEVNFNASNSFTGGTLIGGTNTNSGCAIQFVKGSFGTGPIIILGGTNTLLGAGPATNEVDVYGGSLYLNGTYSGPWNLWATSTLTAPLVSPPNASHIANLSGVISGTGGLTFTNGTLALSGSNTYTGPTTIITPNESTFILSTNASINNTTSLTLGGQATLLISNSSFSLGSNTTLTVLDGYSTVLLEARSNFFNLGSQPIIFSVSSLASGWFLTIDASAILYSNNPVTITNTSGSPWATGSYELIHGGIGYVSSTIGSPNPSVSVLGAGLATNTAAFVTLNEGSLYITISPAVTSPPQVTVEVSSNTFQLSATVVPGAAYWVQSTTNLTPPVTWTNLATGLANSNGLIQFNATNFSTNSGVFYRLAFP